MIFILLSFFLIQSKLNIYQLHYFTRSSAVDIRDIIIIIARVFAQYMGIVMLLRMLKCMLHVKTTPSAK